VNATRSALFKSALDNVLKINANTKAKHVVSPSSPSTSLLLGASPCCCTPAPALQLLTHAALRPQAVVNKFSDATAAELKKLRSARRRTGGGRRLAELAGTVPDGEPLAPGRQLLQDTSNVPDWSTALPNVRNQGSCGSCWAFASAVMGEWGHYQNVGELISLSTKHLVDCNRANGGCDGGWYDPAFEFMKSPGLVDEDTYPYVASQSACPALPAAASKLASYRMLPSNDEAGMLKALQDGPIAVAVFADDGWNSYGGGVYTSASCNVQGDGDVNHAVVVVGAGVDGETGTPFWLIRNSWGADWGEGGYMR
jgi:hypothetical protein